MKQYILALILLLTLPLMPGAPFQVGAEELLLDFVIASIEGTPITLSEVAQRANVPQPTSLQEAASNETIQATLQGMIYERLLKAEARRERVGASKEEIERYIDRVASQNSLSKEEFITALEAEGKSYNLYKQQVEMDIIRTKLASALMRDGVTISEEEVTSHLESNPDLTSTGSKVKLRQIVLERERVSPEEAATLLNDIRTSVDSVASFAAAARTHSHGGEAKDGGLLGVLTQEELRGPIFDALYNLQVEEVSAITETGLGYHLFLIEERYSHSEDSDDDDDSSDSNYREEVRKELQQRKLGDRMQQYFAQELLEKYAVEKKI